MTVANRLKICMVTTFYPPYHFGGDGVFVYRLAHALADRGHEISVIHSVDAYHLQHPGEPTVTFAEHPNVQRLELRTAHPSLSALSVHQTGGLGVYRSRLRKLLSHDGFDVIHYHNVSLMGAPGLLKLGRAVKLYTTHEYWLVCPTHVLFAFNDHACTSRKCLRCTLSQHRPPQVWRYTGRLARGLRHVDRLLVPSHFGIETHRAAGVTRPMVHLPHFVLPEQVDPPTESNELPERPYFLCAGRLEKLKGIQTLLPVFAKYPDADLVIVGDGAYGDTLRTLADGLDNVRFVGQLHPSELAAYYRGAIAVMVPSLCYETFGLTAAEANGQGTPTIVRRIGALPEIIEQGGGGYAYENSDECRQAMERLQQDESHRAELGRRGREAAKKLWSLETHIERYLGVIEDVLAERRGATTGGRT